MARSLDHLIDFLLEEIALDGDQGVTLKDVATYIRKFYDAAETTQASESTLAKSAFKLDQGFLASVWEWLTREDDILIDDTKEHKSWSFDQLVTQYPSALDGIDFDNGSQGNIKDKVAVPQSLSSHCPRITVNIHRIHQAICGHGPDPSRVPASEYALLSVIARTRGEGILQGVAGRVTGQDKRSVPKRTDLLHSKGYIVKRTVLAGGQKTSRLMLKRFARVLDSSSNFLVKDLAVRIVSTLQSDQFMTQEDLATILSLTDPARLRVLKQVVGQLVRRKCLKKVKAAFGPDSDVGELKVCVQVVRELKESDWAFQDQDNIPFTTSVEDAILKAENDIEAADPDANDIADGAEIDQADEQTFQYIPQWNPDRLIPNVLWELTANAGEEGITNTSARGNITGFCVRRPLESTLVRVSHSSLKRQPAHIRELGIVRSTEVENASARYVHRTFDSFKSLVQQNLAKWAAVEGGNAFAKTNPEQANETESDEFGFPVRRQPAGQISNGLVDLEDVAQVPEARPLKASPRDFLLVERPNGKFNLSMTITGREDVDDLATSEPPTPIARSKASTKARSPLVKKSTISKHHPQGRPRKFSQGTEKFWRDMLLVRKLEDDPTYSRRSGLAGLTQDVELLDWYNDRPQHYDDTILLVLQKDLPLPYSSQNVNQSWVEQMKAYMNRSGPGLFITPPGATKVLRGTFQRLVTLRSTRLREIDFRERLKVPAVLFLVSSAAHTFRCNKFDPLSSAQTDKKAAKKTNLKVIRKVPEPGLELAPGRSVLQSASVSDRNPSATPELNFTNQLRRKDDSQRDDREPTKEHSNVTPPEVTRPKRKSAKLRQTVEKSISSQKSASPTLQQDVTQVAAGRSTRSRKPTQKALESNVELQPTRRRSSTTSRQNLAAEFETPSEELRQTDRDAVDTNSLRQESYIGEEESEITEPLPAHQWILQPPEIEIAKTSEVTPKKASATKAREMSVESDQDSALVANGKTCPAVEIQHRAESVLDHEQNPAHTATLEQTAPTSSDSPEAMSEILEPPLIPDTAIHNSVQSSTFTPVNLPKISSSSATNSGIIPSTLEQPEATNSDTAEPESLVLDDATAYPSASPIADVTPILRGRDAVEHYKIILLEILHMCGGVIPNSPMLWRRAVRAKSFEAGIDDNPSVKLLRSQMNRIASSGKVKVLNFAYQRNGLNHTKAIVALPHIQLTDPTFLNMQQKMIALPVEDEYIPPELAAEIERKPSAAAKRDLMAGKAARVLTPKPKRQPKRTEKPQREITPLDNPSQMPVSPPSPPSPPPVVSANTGFLTLKVAKIAQIQTSNTFTSHYFDLNPATTIRFEADANEAATQTALPLPPSQRRSGVRIPRATTYQPGSRKIQWGVPKQPKQPRRMAIPTSLKAILSQKKEDLSSLIASLESFERDVERVKIWEENNSTLLRDPRPEEWHFVNHLVPKKEFTNACDPDQEFVFMQIKVIENPPGSGLLEVEEIDLPEEGSWEQFRKAVAKARSKQKRIDDATSKRKRQFDEFAEGEPDSDFAGIEADTATRKSKRQKKITRKMSTQKRSRHEARGIGLKHLTKEDAFQVCISFVIVRVLAGGLDKYIDFSLVQRLNPSETETLLRERWKVLSHAYLTDMDAFTQDFQTRYLDALADDKVPSVSYHDMAETDWEGILQWALANIDTSGKDLPLEIPPTREEFLALNKVEIIDPTPVRNLYNQSQNYTIASKESIWCSTVNGITNTHFNIPENFGIEAKFPAEEFENNVDAARAKSWVLAAVLTKKEAYDPVKTRAKLRCLAQEEAACDTLLSTTMKQMQADKIIVKQDSSDALNENDGSSYSGTHGWKISRKWFDKFDMNRNITSTMLRDAARYKIQVLDPAFARRQHVDLGRAPFLADGCMVAIFNLLDQGLIQIKTGADVPASRYGLDWEDQGYKTKSMDRDVLSFSTYLQPTLAYEYGDPAESARDQTAVPRGDLDREDGMGRIPTWFNINREFQPQIWNMVVGAVVGLIALRPGLSTLEILRNLGWALQRPDLGMVLKFLYDCTLIQKVSGGWETTLWWWFAVGTGHDSDVGSIVV